MPPTSRKAARNSRAEAENPSALCEGLIQTLKHEALYAFQAC